MAFDAGAITARLTLDDGDFTSTLSSSQKASAAWGAAVGAATVAAAAAFSRAGAKMEQTLVSYQTFLGGSKKKTDELVKSLNNFANATPFTNEQILQAGKSLMAFGASTESIQPRLKAIGDIAAGTGKDFNELALIFGKAMSSGVVQAEELNQLTEAGVPIIKQLAKQFGVAESQVKKLGSQGKIGFKDLEKAFQGMTSKGGLFFNLMEKQSATFSGMVSTLKGSLGLLASEIGMVLNDLLKPMLAALVSGAKNVLAWWQGLEGPAKSVAVALTGTVAGVTSLILLLPMLKAAAAFFGVLAIKVVAVAAAIAAVVAGLVAIVNRLKQTGQLQVVLDSLAKAWETIKRVASQAWEAIKKALNFGSMDVDVGGLVSKVATGFGKIVVIVSFLVEQLPNIVKLQMEKVARIFDNAILKIKRGWLEMRVLWERFQRFTAGTSLDRAVFTSRINDLRGQIRDVGIDIDNNAEALERVRRAEVGITDELDRRLKKMDELAKKAASTTNGGGGGGGKKPKPPPGGGGGKGFKDVASQLIQPAMSAISDVMNATFTGMQNRIKATQERAGLFMSLFTQQFNREMEAQLEALREAEDEKIRILQEASNERLAVIDEEFAHRKRLLEQELQAQLASIQAEKEARLLFVDENAAIQEQKVLLSATIEEDAKRLAAQAERDFHEKLRSEEQKTTSTKKEEEAKRAAAVAAAQAEKKKKEEEFLAQKEAREKQHAKTGAMIEYMGALSAYRVSQQQARAQAQFSYAAALVSTAQAVAQMAAIPGVGLPLALSMGGALTALATASFGAAIGAIASAPPPLPPASLFARDGGVITGPSHSNGGVMVNAEGGEAFLSRTTTTRLDAFLQKSEMSGGAQNVFEPGAIMVMGSLDPRAADLIAEAITERQGMQIHRVIR